MNNPFRLFKKPIEIYFFENENEKQFSEDMWNAYQKCEETGISTKWIKENDCLNFQFQLDSSYIFVLEKFEGKVFEKLQSKEEHSNENPKCSIFGPKFLLHCFLKRGPIPPRMNLVLNNSMDNTIIYLSDCTPEELLSYQKKIKHMNGFTMDVLHHNVTHFITNSVFSKNYLEATQKALKIYRKDWISAVWVTNLKLSFSANDEKFNEYKTPIFMNLAMKTVNLSTDEINEIRRLIEQHGGEFKDLLDGEKHKILITKENKITEKDLNNAKKAKIPCLSLDWVRDSVKTGYALPFNKFLITKALIQPLEKRLEYSKKNLIPSIPKSPEIIKKQTVRASKVPEDYNNDKENKENIPISSDHCIHVVGFPSIEESRINKMINEIKGLKVYRKGNQLTHLLIGDVNESMKTLSNIQTKGLKPHILGIQWLEESFKLKKLVPEKPFELVLKEELNMSRSLPSIPPSSLMKTNPGGLKKALSTRVPVSQINNLPQVSVPSKIHGFPKKSISNPSKIDTSTKMSSNPSKKIPQLFKNLKFLITGLTRPSPSLINAITAFGGRILSENPKEIPDYAIVPLAGDYSGIKAKEIVTRSFIQDCASHDKKVDIKYYHKPIYVPENVKPLKDCVIYFGDFSSEIEIKYLSKLVIALGALNLGTLSRDYVQKGENGTFLICGGLKGDKGNTADKWKVPIVSGEWLRACADELKLVDKQQFLVK